MSQRYSIRQLSGGDLDAMYGLLNMFAEVFGEPETYMAKQPATGNMQSLLERKDFCAGGRAGR